MTSHTISFDSKKSFDFHKEYPNLSPAFIHELAIDLTRKCLNSLDGSLNNDVATKLFNSVNSLIKSNNETKKQLLDNQSFLSAEYKNQINHLNNQKLDEIKKAIDDTAFTKLNSIVASDNAKLEETLNKIKTFIGKLENSTTKGAFSEEIMLNTLTTKFKTAEIENVSKTKESCDFKFMRKDKPTILIENKCYSQNVPKIEVEKFLRDTDLNNCSGILLSQTSGICNKNHFQMDLHNGNILVYIHDVNYNSELVENAVNMIDHVKSALQNIVGNNSENILIDNNTLNEINKEFQQVIQQKLILSKCVKDFQVKLQKEIDDIKMPNLFEILSKHFAFSNDITIICKYCKKIQKNQQALSAHLRGSGECAIKKQLEEKEEKSNTADDHHSNISEIKVESQTELLPPPPPVKKTIQKKTINTTSNSKESDKK